MIVKELIEFLQKFPGDTLITECRYSDCSEMNLTSWSEEKILNNFRKINWSILLSDKDIETLSEEDKMRVIKVIHFTGN